MAHLLRNLLLFASILTPSLAIPATEPQNPLSYTPAGSQRTPAKTRFTQLKDSIIEKIWSVPEKTSCHNYRPKSAYAAPANFRTKYGGDVVLRFNITTQGEAQSFSEAANILYLDVWDSSSTWVDVRIAKEMVPSLLNLLPASLQNSHTPLMHDLAQAVFDTYPSSGHTDTWRARHDTVHRNQPDFFFTQYQPLSVINPWLTLLAAEFPEVVSLFSIGQSAEGRDIQAVRIGAPILEQPPDDEVNARQTVLVVGGSHAREWISVSTATYLAWTLATRYGVPAFHDVTKILKHFDFIIIPVLNPDGYEYSWGTDRLWRKSRQATSLPFCPGIDLDRAFAFEWDGEAEKDNPCTESYAGEFAFQAVESKVLAEWAVNTMRDDGRVFTGFIDLHSYSQKVLYPYSYACDIEPHNLEDLEEIGYGFAKAFFLQSWHFYQVSPACESQFSYMTEKDGKKVRQRIDGVNNNGGSSLDYFYESLRVKYAYQIKLRDTGTYGFLLPKEEIVPSGIEIYQGLMHFGHWLLGNRGIESTGEEQELSPYQNVEDNVVDEWASRDPERIFRPYQSQESVPVAEDNDDDEWERIFDEELRRRRR